MERQIEYIKYTTAIAIALLLYIPAQFLPAEAATERVILVAAEVVLALSIAAGVLYHARATTMLVKETAASAPELSEPVNVVLRPGGWQPPAPPAPPTGGPAPRDWYMKLWGRLHLGLLLLGLAVTAVFFFNDIVFAPVAVAKDKCELTLPAAEGRSVVLRFACETEEIAADAPSGQVAPGPVVPGRAELARIRRSAMLAP